MKQTYWNAFSSRQASRLAIFYSHAQKIQQPVYISSVITSRFRLTISVRYVHVSQDTLENLVGIWPIVKKKCVRDVSQKCPTFPVHQVLAGCMSALMWSLTWKLSNFPIIQYIQNMKQTQSNQFQEDLFRSLFLGLQAWLLYHIPTEAFFYDNKFNCFCHIPEVHFCCKTSNQLVECMVLYSHMYIFSFHIFWDLHYTPPTIILTWTLSAFLSFTEKANSSSLGTTYT